MNLIACNGCGVVMDKDKLHFPYNIYKDYAVDENKAMWNGEDWVAKVECPVCHGDIPEEE